MESLMTEKRRFVRPVVTRSRVVLEMAEYLADDNEWPFQHSRIHMRPQGGDAKGVAVRNPCRHVHQQGCP
jgi:hypothetical protein